MADFMLLLIILPATSCQGKLYVSPEKSMWSSSDKECIPATPEVGGAISYSPSVYSVTNIGIDLPYKEDMWVGYYQVERVFEYIGCVEQRYFFKTQQQFVTIKGDPGHCFPYCGESTVVGVTKTRCYCLGDVFNYTRNRENGCTDKCNNPIVACGLDRTPAKYTYISIYKINPKVTASSISVTPWSSAEKDCLSLYPGVPSRFYWNTCSLSLKAMCFDDGLVDTIQCRMGLEYCTWIDAVNACFHKGRFPTSYSYSKYVIESHLSPLWTGLFKTNVVYKYNANIPEERRHDKKQFGYLTKESETNVKLKFTDGDSMKKILCMQDRSKKKTPETYVSLVTVTGFSSFSSTVLPNTSDTDTDNSISVVIVVCCVAVVLIVIAVLMTIGVMKKRKRRRNQGANQTRGEYVPEQPVYFTPISDEAMDGAYSTVQGNGIGGGNDGYEIPNPKKNVYEPLGDRRDEEHGYGTPAQTTGRLYQRLEEETVDTQEHKTAEKSRELEYDSLEDTTKHTRNKETSDQTANAAAYEWVH